MEYPLYYTRSVLKKNLELPRPFQSLWGNRSLEQEAVVQAQDWFIRVAVLSISLPLAIGKAVEDVDDE